MSFLEVGAKFATRLRSETSSTSITTSSGLDEGPGEDPLYPLDDHGGRDVLHADVVVGAAPHFPQVARCAGYVGTNDGMGPSVGSDPDRVGRPEDTDNGAAHGHRHVHRAGVIGHADGRPPDEGDQPGDGRLSGKVMGAGASRDDCLAAGSIPGRPRNDNLVAGFEEVPADLCKAGNRPVLRFPDGPGHQDREGLSTQSVGPQQFLDRPRRLGRQVDREIRRAVVEPKHRREPKIPVHRMDIEGGDGDPVGIRDPGPLAGPGPSMLAGPPGGRPAPSASV